MIPAPYSGSSAHCSKMSETWDLVYAVAIAMGIGLPLTPSACLTVS